MAFWHPSGWVMFRELEAAVDRIREVLAEEGHPADLLIEGDSVGGGRLLVIGRGDGARRITGQVISVCGGLNT